MSMEPSDAPTVRVLRLAPLDHESFSPFGEVVSVRGQPTPVNDGRALRYDNLVRFRHGTEAIMPALSLYHVSASTLPFAVALFECHPHSGQLFLPMMDGRFLVVVAPDRDGRPDLDKARAFLPGAGVGIHYQPGIWHVPMAALGADTLLAMVMWEGAGTTTVEYRLEHPLSVDA
jgi:ureidoglycolate lyase